MNTRLFCITLFLLAFIVSPTLWATDIQQAKKMHQTHCFQCHDAGVYTAKKSNLSNKMELLKRVTGCSRAADTNWTSDEIKLVADYLNQSFYQFP